MTTSPLRYSPSPMAVPKQKQSHSRTTQRRSQHKVSAPTFNACPQCHSPRRPHRVCPVCGTLRRPRGRRARARARSRSRPLGSRRRRSRSRSPSTPTALISALPRSPRGAALAAGRGVRVLLFGPADAFGDVADGVEVVDAPMSIAKAADPVTRRARSKPDASIVQAARAVAAGDVRRARRGGSTGAALAAALFHIKRDRGIYRPGARAAACRFPGAPVTLLDVGANVEVRPEHLVQFAFMGAAFAQVVLGIAAPRVGAAVQRRGGRRRARRSCARRTRARRAVAAALDFVGNVEGTDVTAGVADVVVTDGFTGNVALKLIEGVSQTHHRARSASARRRRRAARLGGLLLRPRAARAARRDRSRGRRAAPTCSACAAWASSPHGRFTRARLRRRRSCSPRAACASDVVGPHARRARGAPARCVAVPPRPRRASSGRSAP